MFRAHYTQASYLLEFEIQIKKGQDIMNRITLVIAHLLNVLRSPHWKAQTCAQVSCLLAKITKKQKEVRGKNKIF